MEETGLAEIKRHELALAKRGESSIFLDVERFEFAKKVAGMLAASTMVPDHFRGGAGVGNCMIMLNLSERLGIDVFGLMQTSYTVHGRPGFEAKLLIALFNERTKLFVPPLRWEMKGDFPKGKDAACRAYAKDKETGENLYGDWIDFDLIQGMGWYDKPGPDKKVESNMWRNMPGQMYRYRSASFFINAYEPGLKMGIQTIDELEDMIIDVTPERTLKVANGAESKEGVDLYSVKGEAENPPQASQDAPGSTKSPDPEPEAKDPFREEWINLKSHGYSTYIHTHLEELRTLSPEDLQEAKAKWHKLYAEPWPLDPKPEVKPITPAEEVAAGIHKRHEEEKEVKGNGASIWCPEKKRYVFIRVCEGNCDDKPKCQAYSEWEYQNRAPVIEEGDAL